MILFHAGPRNIRITTMPLLRMCAGHTGHAAGERGR